MWIAEHSAILVICEGDKGMKHYNVEIIIDNEQQEQRIEELTRRLKKVNGWNEQEIIQFMLLAFPKIYDTLLSLMEFKVDDMD